MKEGTILGARAQSAIQRAAVLCKPRLATLHDNSEDGKGKGHILEEAMSPGGGGGRGVALVVLLFFLTSALDGVGGQSHAPAALLLG
jgi:hypothetical protein